MCLICSKFVTWAHEKSKLIVVDIWGPSPLIMPQMLCYSMQQFQLCRSKLMQIWILIWKSEVKYQSVITMATVRRIRPKKSCLVVLHRPTLCFRPTQIFFFIFFICYSQLKNHKTYQEKTPQKMLKKLLNILSDTGQPAVKSLRVQHWVSTY